MAAVKTSIDTEIKNLENDFKTTTDWRESVVSVIRRSKSLLDGTDTSVPAVSLRSQYLQVQSTHGAKIAADANLKALWEKLATYMENVGAVDIKNPLPDDKMLTFPVNQSTKEALEWFDRDDRTKREDMIGMQRELKIVRDALEGSTILPEVFGKIRGLIMYGPAGTGKTVLAQVIGDLIGKRLTETYPLWFDDVSIKNNNSKTGSYAKDNNNQNIDVAKKPILFWNWNGADLRGPYGGNTEKNIKAAFKAADEKAIEQGPHTLSLVFLDEVETLASRRADDPSMNASVTSLLTAIDGVVKLKQTKIIAATNLPWALDEAFLSRFPVKVFVDLPNQSSREDLILFELWNYYFPSAIQKLVQLVGKPIMTGVDHAMTAQDITTWNSFGEKINTTLIPKKDNTNNVLTKNEAVDAIGALVQSKLFCHKDSEYLHHLAETPLPNAKNTKSWTDTQLTTFVQNFKKFSKWKENKEIRTGLLKRTTEQGTSNHLQEDDVKYLAKRFGMRADINDLKSSADSKYGKGVGDAFIRYFQDREESKIISYSEATNRFGWSNRDISSYMQTVFFKQGSLGFTGYFLLSDYSSPGCGIEGDVELKKQDGTTVKLPKCDLKMLPKVIKGKLQYGTGITDSANIFNKVFATSASSVNADVYLDYIYYDLYKQPPPGLFSNNGKRQGGVQSSWDLVL